MLPPHEKENPYELKKETAHRQANADYLIAGLNHIGGVAPARLPLKSRAVSHLFLIRYDAAQFNGLPKGKFIQAMGKEAIPCGGGYSDQYNDGILDEAINSPGYKRFCSAERMKAYRESLKELKRNTLVLATTVGMSQTLLLADRSAMDHILDAIRKIKSHSAELAKGA